MAAGCELLSNSISLIFWYNKDVLLNTRIKVVNCFQILYLWYSDTTNSFCFVNQFRCELLSNSISLIFWYNKCMGIFAQPFVVNCFQILYLWYSDTTTTGIIPFSRSLWIAFKFYIFDILIQLYYPFFRDRFSCELLSNSISLIFWYNKSASTYC